MTKVLIGNIMGPQGPAGDTGPQGDPGTPGAGSGANVVTVTNSTTLDGTETAVLVDGVNLIITLANATLMGTMPPVVVKLIHPFTTCIIRTSHGQVIDGGFSEYPLETTGQWVSLQADGHNWESVGAKTGGDLAVPFTSLPDGVIDVPYSIKLTATGGWPGYLWALKSGFLPQGLSITQDGVISGTLTASGTNSFVIQLTDSVGSIITVPVSITAVPPPSGSDIFLINRGIVAIALTSEITPAFGGPTQAGNFLAARVCCNGSGPVATDADGWVVLGGTSGGAALALKMDCADDETPPTFTGGSATSMFSYLEEWSGVVTTDALDKFVEADGAGGPSWLAEFMDSDSLSGELVIGAGSWNGSNLGGEITITAFRDSLGNTIDAPLVQGANAYGQYFGGTAGVLGPTGSFTNQLGMELSVFAGGRGVMASIKSANAGPPGAPSITTSSPLKAGSTFQPYRTKLNAQNGVPPYTFTLADDSAPLPTGLTLSTDGTISGTPTVAGDTEIDFEVSDTFSQVGDALLTIPIAETPAVTFTTTLAQGTSQGYTSDNITGVPEPVPVNNNVWAPVAGWRSTLSVVDPTNFWIVANFPAGNTQVSSYPSLGCYFDEMSLSRFSKIVSSWDEEMNGTSGSQAWAAYDLWLNNWGNEIMVQVDLDRFNTFESTPLERAISFGGSNGVPVVTWDLHKYGGTEFVWHPTVGQGNFQTGSIDILQMFQWMIDHAYLPADNTVTAFGYGWEICSTGGLDQFFKVNDFTMDVIHT